jgi:hypothetical protein
LYSGVEAVGVSQVYKKYSFAKNHSNIVVLDIEVSLKSNDPDKSELKSWPTWRL